MKVHILATVSFHILLTAHAAYDNTVQEGLWKYVCICNQQTYIMVIPSIHMYVVKSGISQVSK